MPEGIESCRYPAVLEKTRTENAGSVDSARAAPEAKVANMSAKPHIQIPPKQALRRLLNDSTPRCHTFDTTSRILPPRTRSFCNSENLNRIKVIRVRTGLPGFYG